MQADHYTYSPKEFSEDEACFIRTVRAMETWSYFTD